jgi:hypothetical protein
MRRCGGAWLIVWSDGYLLLGLEKAACTLFGSLTSGHNMYVLSFLYMNGNPAALFAIWKSCSQYDSITLRRYAHNCLGHLSQSHQSISSGLSLFVPIRKLALNVWFCCHCASASAIRSTQHAATVSSHQPAHFRISFVFSLVGHSTVPVVIS